MDKFPIDIIHQILEYDGKIKHRNGKYMNQIARNDARYIMLLKLIPKTIEKRVNNDDIMYKTYVDLTKFKIICWQDNPLWYKRPFIVHQRYNSGLYTNIFVIE